MRTSSSVSQKCELLNPNARYSISTVWKAPISCLQDANYKSTSTPTGVICTSLFIEMGHSRWKSQLQEEPLVETGGGWKFAGTDLALFTTAHRSTSWIIFVSTAHEGKGLRNQTKIMPNNNRQGRPTEKNKLKLSCLMWNQSQETAHSDNSWRTASLQILGAGWPKSSQQILWR